MEPKDTKSSVKTAARTLDVFEAFAEARQPLTLSELSEKIDAPLSSCHALAKTLQKRGYLYYFEWRRLIYPTKKLYDIGMSIATHDPILQQLQPMLTQLRHETGETVILGKRHDNEVVYLDVIEGTQTIRYTAHPGERKPLHSSAIGKAMLSVMPASEFDRFLQNTKLEVMTPDTITAGDRLRKDIKAGVERGYFVTRGENVVDVMAFSMVLRIASETMAFAVAGPITRLDRNETSYVRSMHELVSAVGVLQPDQR